MATLENSIYTYLLAQSSLTAYVGDRIFWPAKDPEVTEDYICYQVAIASNPSTAFGDTTTGNPLVQFDVYSMDPGRALAIGNLLVTLLHGFSGALGTGGNTVTLSSADGPMVFPDDSAEGWYHGVVDWRTEYTR